MNKEYGELPFADLTDEEEVLFESPLSITEEDDEPLDYEEESCLINELYETMDSMVDTMKQMQECIFRLATPQLRFCPPKFLKNLESCLDEYEFVSSIHVETPGYRTFVSHHCGGKDPFEDVSFKVHMKQLRESCSWLSDLEAYDYSWDVGTYEDIFDKLRGYFYDPDDSDYDDFEELLFLAQRSFKYMTCDRNAMLYLNKRFILERERKDKTLVAMRDEICFLYHLLRVAGIRIPLEGHSVDLNAFADESDPQRGAYEDGCEIDYAYFDYSGIDWD